jgi:DNA-binding beta-propeller fold protein YncE
VPARYAYITNVALHIALKSEHASSTTTDVKANTVSVFRISPGTGTLSAKPASTAATVLHPQAIAITADGKNAYLTSGNKGALSQYAINPASGKITRLSTPGSTTRSG